jgi:spermidine synthase
MSNKYGGQLLHATADEYGPIEVVELQQKMRSLHFGNKTRQATMFLYNPALLVHKYTQAMMTPLCWQRPERVLMLGLGGGSIAKYLLHFSDHIRIDAVELRPAVISVAREYFALPEAGVDAAARYDLIVVDMFLTAREKDVSVGLGDQLDRLSALMSERGSMCINVIGDNVGKHPQLHELQRLFPDNLYLMRVEQSNIVLLACNGGIPRYGDIDFTTQERKFGLPFRQYFDQLADI